MASQHTYWYMYHPTLKASDHPVFAHIPGFHPEIFLRGSKIRVLKMRWDGAQQCAIYIGGSGGMLPQKILEF